MGVKITEKRAGELEWEYAAASRNIYDTLIDIDSDDSGDDDNPDVTDTIEDSRDCTGKDDRLPGRLLSGYGVMRHHLDGELRRYR